MKRLTTILAAACLALLGAAPAAQGAFGVNGFDVTFTDAEGAMVTEAGSHPFAMTTTLGANVDGEGAPEGWLRNLFFEQVPGLVGDTTAYPRCSTLEFLELVEGINNCPLNTALGISASSTSKPGLWSTAPVFNLTPPPGVLLRLGFRAVVMNIVIDVGLSPEPPYLPVAVSRNVPQLADVYANKTQLWGNPSDPRHDRLRGPCGSYVTELPPGEIEAFQFEASGEDTCPVTPNEKPLLTLPTTCAEPLRSSLEVVSWAGEVDSESRLTHDQAGNPEAFAECGKLGFKPEIKAEPTSRAAESPTGLDFALEVDDEGLTSLDGRSQSHIRKAVVTLPKGMTANPSLAEGLEVCSEGDLGRETLQAAPGEGCPQASKIGTIEVQSPLVEEPVGGALYQAEPYANLAGDALIAFYIVIKNPKLGIIVKQPVKVDADPATGQLRATTAEDIPQVPFSSFRLKFREGARSPLVSPPTCGSHAATATLTPWAGGEDVTSVSAFEIVSGPNGGPCPPGGSQPFEPGFEAGSINNAAGAFSPFSMRLTRRDGDQDLTRFDATLPQGVLARLAGVSRCPDAKIALADSKTGIAERGSPSCPLNSRIGSVQAGAGVGSQLTYVPGSVYLAGPFAGAPLSVAAVVPAVAGPFDIGTVVTRQALVVDPRTGEVTADGSRSEPIPHILAGIPLRVRDIQVNIDRPGFTLNPTSCEPMATSASIWGGGANPFSIFDDAPVLRSARYQAAGCAALGFKPRLGLRLKGGARRGDHPALRTVFRPRAGQANARRVVVRFPRSAFVEQAHIRTVCTRVQFAADRCPNGSIYGQVEAITPLLANPLRGPVYLRSSDNVLPDLVFDLKGEVDFEAVARIDSVRGALRAVAHGIPDAPISSVVIQMRGGRKSLIVNSKDLCRRKNRARISFEGHNGKRAIVNTPVAAAACSKRKPRKTRRSTRGAPR